MITFLLFMQGMIHILKLGGDVHDTRISGKCSKISPMSIVQPPDPSLFDLSAILRAG